MTPAHVLLALSDVEDSTPVARRILNVLDDELSILEDVQRHALPCDSDRDDAEIGTSVRDRLALLARRYHRRLPAYVQRAGSNIHALHNAIFRWQDDLLTELAPDRVAIMDADDPEDTSRLDAAKAGRRAA